MTNVIGSIEIATTGNATDFGDLLTAGWLHASCASPITALALGGNNSSSRINTIQGVTIATTGNSTDFGDLTVAVQNFAACSNGHGGLG